MDRRPKSLLGVGIYSVSETSRLTGVSPRRIRCWLGGYTYRARQRDELRFVQPLFRAQHAPIKGSLALSFLDLVEVRFVDAFRSRGVTWPTLRKAAARAQKLFGTDHPFATQRLFTDGHAIFAEIPNGVREKGLMDIVRSQPVFRKLIEPFIQVLDFSPEDLAVRWYPLAGDRNVVIDPARGFGQPIVTKEGVPTSALYKAHLAGESDEKIIRWYEVSKESLRAAIAFEAEIAA